MDWVAPGGWYTKHCWSLIIHSILFENPKVQPWLIPLRLKAWHGVRVTLRVILVVEFRVCLVNLGAFIEKGNSDDWQQLASLGVSQGWTRVISCSSCGKCRSVKNLAIAFQPPNHGQTHSAIFVASARGDCDKSDVVFEPKKASSLASPTRWTFSLSV
jgi:hypothetical protein